MSRKPRYSNPLFRGKPNLTRTYKMGAPKRRRMNYTTVPHQELKYRNFDRAIDLTAGGDFVIDPVTEKCLSSIPQGDEHDDRNGRVVTLKSLFIGGYFEEREDFEQLTTNRTNAVGPMFIDLAVVLDTQTNKTQMTSSDFWSSGNILGNPLRVLRNSSRFRVLHREVYTMPPLPVMCWYSAGEGHSLILRPASRKPFRINLKFKKPIKVNQSGSGGNVESVNDNSIHLLVSIPPPASTKLNDVTITYNARIRFCD